MSSYNYVMNENVFYPIRWKNNVERKNKFLILQRDASYCENTDDKLITRQVKRFAVMIKIK